MAAKSASLQDHFLNSARKSRRPLTLFLLKGIKLEGVLASFDAFSLLLRRQDQAQLVYKHSVATIVSPDQPAACEFASDDSSGRAALQDSFLSEAARDRHLVTLFLVNGVMIEGVVLAHDQFSLLLERGGQAQLVYKHAISTIQPKQSVALAAAAGGEE